MGFITLFFSTKNDHGEGRERLPRLTQIRRMREKPEAVIRIMQVLGLTHSVVCKGVASTTYLLQRCSDVAKGPMDVATLHNPATLQRDLCYNVARHVHEKAIIMVTVPLLVAAAGGGSFAGGQHFVAAIAALSLMGTFSVLPLMPQRLVEVVNISCLLPSSCRSPSIFFPN